MSHPYKLLVVDVDGTLLDRRRAISVEDREALAKVVESGVQISLSTGRAARACTALLNQLSLDGYHGFFDGALVANSEVSEELYAEYLSPTVVQQAIEFAHSNDIDLDLYSTAHYFVERETWSAIAHQQFFGIEPMVVDFSQIWNQERIIKIGLVSTSAQEGEKVGHFCLRFDGSCHFSRARTPVYPGVDFINVVAPGVSKGKALEVLASHLGVVMSEVIAVGDGINDISLLSSAGLAIAMGNAPDEVKAVADHITLDVAHSGLAAAINRFLL